VAEVAARLGTTTHSMYAWIKRYDPQQPKITESNDPRAELAKLKKTSATLWPFSVTCFTASILNSSGYRLLLISTSLISHFI
jgi:hypothetical protein